MTRFRYKPDNSGKYKDTSLLIMDEEMDDDGCPYNEDEAMDKGYSDDKDDNNGLLQDNKGIETDKESSTYEIKNKTSDISIIDNVNEEEDDDDKEVEFDAGDHGNFSLSKAQWSATYKDKSEYLTPGSY